VFTGSRVPNAALFKNLEDGITVKELIEIFPAIKLETAESYNEMAKLCFEMKQYIFSQLKFMHSIKRTTFDYDLDNNSPSILLSMSAASVRLYFRLFIS